MYLQLTFIRNETIIVLRVTALFDQDVHLLPLQLLSWDIIQSINTLVMYRSGKWKYVSNFKGSRCSLLPPMPTHDISWAHSEHCWMIANPRLLLVQTFSFSCHRHFERKFHTWSFHCNTDKIPLPPKFKNYTKIQMLSLILNFDCTFSKNRMTNTMNNLWIARVQNSKTFYNLIKIFQRNKNP